MSYEDLSPSQQRVLAKVAKASPRRQKRFFEHWLHWREIPLIVWLVLLWMLLWQEISPMSLLSGLIIAITLTRVFFLPPVELAGRFNIIYALRYLCVFIYMLILGALQVSWLAVRIGKRPRPAVISVELKTHSDFILTMTGLTISLIPGSLIVDIDRNKSIIYLHALNAPGQHEQDKLRREVLNFERMLVQAVGSRQELEVCDAHK